MSTKSHLESNRQFAKEARLGLSAVFVLLAVLGYLLFKKSSGGFDPRPGEYVAATTPSLAPTNGLESRASEASDSGIEYTDRDADLIVSFPESVGRMQSDQEPTAQLAGADVSGDSIAAGAEDHALVAHEEADAAENGGMAGDAVNTGLPQGAFPNQLIPSISEENPIGSGPGGRTQFNPANPNSQPEDSLPTQFNPVPISPAPANELPEIGGASATQLPVNGSQLEDSLDRPNRFGASGLNPLVEAPEVESSGKNVFLDSPLSGANQDEAPANYLPESPGGQFSSVTQDASVDERGDPGGLRPGSLPADNSSVRGETFDPDRIGSMVVPDKYELVEAEVDETPASGTVPEKVDSLPPKFQNLQEAGELEWVVADENSTYWSIAQQSYGDGNLMRALCRFNIRRYQGKVDLEPGDRVAIPARKLLEQFTDEQVPDSPVFDGASDSATREYQTKDGETIFSIAAEQLGQASRYTEVWELNSARAAAWLIHSDEIAKRDSVVIAEVTGVGLVAIRAPSVRN